MGGLPAGRGSPAARHRDGPRPEALARRSTRDQAEAGTAAIDVAQSALDLELRYRPPAEIDLARFELWARQILVDASASDMGGITGDVATLEWIRDRFTHMLDPADVTRINAHLLELQGSVADKDPAAAREEAASLETRSPS